MSGEHALMPLRGLKHDLGVIESFQYLSLPHVFLLDSRTPVGFLPDSYWISTNFPKRHFHIFFHSLPIGLLLNSYWTPTGLPLDSN